MQAWCVDCRKLSPKTETLYELGAEGWRVAGSAKGDFQWRCPACWITFKELMREASISSARFRAAAPREPRVPSCSAERGQTDDHPRRPEDTRRDDRVTMIASVIGQVFRLLSPVLSTAPVSSRARELAARAERYASLVSHWEDAPPGQEEQIALFEELSRLHADASALVAAYRRDARIAR